MERIFSGEIKHGRSYLKLCPFFPSRNAAQAPAFRARPLTFLHKRPRSTSCSSQLHEIKALSRTTKSAWQLTLNQNQTKKQNDTWNIEHKKIINLFSKSHEILADNFRDAEYGLLNIIIRSMIMRYTHKRNS